MTFHDLKTFSEMQWLFQAWNPNFKYNDFWLLTVWTLVSPWHFVLQFQVWISLAKQSGLKNEAMHVLCVYRFYFLLLSLGFSFPYSSRLYQDDSLPQFSFLSFEPSVIYTGEWVHWHCQSCQIKPTVVSRMLHCILGHRNLNSDAAKQFMWKLQNLWIPKRYGFTIILFFVCY